MEIYSLQVSVHVRNPKDYSKYGKIEFSATDRKVLIEALRKAIQKDNSGDLKAILEQALLTSMPNTHQN